MKFQFTADATFEAHSYADALGQLTQHFAAMIGGQLDGEELTVDDGFIMLYPLDPPTDDQKSWAIEHDEAPALPLWRRCLNWVRGRSAP